jgi:hypothetical protein
MTKKFPISISRLRGLSDRQLEEDRQLRLLEQAILRLPLLDEQKHKVEACARHLFEEDLSARVEIAQKPKKEGVRSSARIANDMRQIKIRSSALLGYFRNVDKNHFESWIDAATSKHEQSREKAISQWHELRQLLAMASETSDQAIKAAKARAGSSALNRNSAGRKKDERADYVTTVAAGVFEQVTGKTAARAIDRMSSENVGEFHRFLGAIFRALGITASPDEANKRLQINLKRIPKK